MKNIINTINIINVSIKAYHVCESRTKDKTKYTKKIISSILPLAINATKSTLPLSTRATPPFYYVLPKATIKDQRVEEVKKHFYT